MSDKNLIRTFLVVVALFLTGVRTQFIYVNLTFGQNQYNLYEIIPAIAYPIAISLTLVLFSVTTKYFNKKEENKELA